MIGPRNVVENSGQFVRSRVLTGLLKQNQLSVPTVHMRKRLQIAQLGRASHERPCRHLQQVRVYIERGIRIVEPPAGPVCVGKTDGVESLGIYLL